MDTKDQKLEIFGSLAMEAAISVSPSFESFFDRQCSEAVRDVDYVITTIRVGQDEARVADEKIAMGFHLLPQETTGAAVFRLQCAPFRLIRLLQLVRDFAKPSVQVFNFTIPPA
jgi:6-phospho-beta-glucosidase